MILAVVVLVLSLAGFADMLYATSIHYGWLTSSPKIPELCPVGAGPCQTAFQSPQAEILGVPISILGMVYYSVISLAAITRMAVGKWPAPPFLIGVSCAAAAYSIYLTWFLLFSVHEACYICFLGHGINLVLAVLFVAALTRRRISGNSAVLQLRL